jgi:multicomponent K+:H+ antiporter subunit F
MTALVLPWAIGAVGLALLLTLYRLLRGPGAVDRALALDTLYVNTIALLIMLGIAINDNIYIEVALVIAMLGFVGTVALGRYLARGEVVE